MERITIVDENDNVIGAKDRDQITKDDIYRVAALWLENSKGEALLAQRSFDKKKDPGKWDQAVSGTVAEGETYRETIIREVVEELGVKIENLEEGPRKLITEKEHKFFGQMFIAKVDLSADDFKIQKSEVAEVKWFSKEGIFRLMKEDPEMFVESMPIVLGQVYGESI